MSIKDVLLMQNVPIIHLNISALNIHDNNYSGWHLGRLT